LEVIRQLLSRIVEEEEELWSFKNQPDLFSDGVIIQGNQACV